MKKFITLFVVVVTTFICVATTEAAQKPCRRQCRTEIRSQIVCAQDKDGRNCRKLKECELREVNCRLRSRKQSILLQTYMQRCRLIKTTTGQNKCAPPITAVRDTSKSKRRTSRRRRVRDCSPWYNNKRTCYHRPGKGDICQLLTACQVERANCQRRWNNQLVRVDKKECKFIKAGEMGRCNKVTKS